MLGENLVRPLEDDWRETLDAVAKSRGWPTSRDVARLGSRVSELSGAYNDPSRARATMRDAGAARLNFSFVRDVPKGAAAVRELVASGALDAVCRGTPLAVLDVGAGLGAMTWGLLRALEAYRGAPVAMEATWVDTDAEALELGRSIALARSRPSAPVVKTAVARADALGRHGVFDVVMLGNVLSEIGVGQPDAARVEDHASLLAKLLAENVRPSGALVVVEPALRDRTRHLHRVRDRLASSGPVPFAPCLHGAACPALAAENDWCHEDLRVDLPSWVAPIARAAGLRYEGLTFSYLVYLQGGPTLAARLGATHGERTVPLRAVSDLIRTKGKRELFVCGEFQTDSGPAVARKRLMRLDRDLAAGNAVFSEVTRGEIALVSPPPTLARPRIDSASAVRFAEVTSRPLAGGESR